MKPRATAVIVTYNSREFVGECLRSLSGLVDAGIIKVIVVDNHSTDDTLELIENEYLWANVIRSPVNNGFAAGNNLALGHLEGEYCFFLNPDTKVGAGCTKELVQYLDDHPDVGCVGPAIVNKNGKRTLSYFAFTGLFTSFWTAVGLQRLLPLNNTNNRWEIRRRKLPAKPVEVNRLLGAAIMIRCKALDDIGNFDEQFFLYSEEEDLCLRLREKGWKVYYIPKSFVVHLGAGSTRRATALSIAAADWSRYLFLKKHRSRFTAELSRIIWIIALSMRYMLTLFGPGLKREGYSLSLNSLLRRGYFERELRPALNSPHQTSGEQK